MSGVTAYYEVFPAPGTDYDEARDIIGDIVRGGYPSVAGSSRNDGSSFIIQATESQVTSLLNHTSIEHVTKIKLPYQQRDDETLGADDEILPWIVFPEDPQNVSQRNEIAAYLQGLSTTQLREYNFLDVSPHPLFYWGVDITNTQGAEVVEHPGVKYAVGTRLGRPGAAVGPSRSGAAAFPVKRAPGVSYARQIGVVKELVSISQPSTVPDIGFFKDYVYEEHAGAGSFVYHVELGVEYPKIASEFPNLAHQHILTPTAYRDHRRTDREYWKYNQGGADQPWHGTCCAGKAVGQLYVPSKKTTLIIVQQWQYSIDESIAAFESIKKDLIAHPERQKHSVVSMSYFNNQYDPKFQPLYDVWKQAIQDVMDLDVPVVECAGNEGVEPGRQMIDQVPAVFAVQDHNFPLITVGSVTAAGVESAWSQTGATIHAVGEEITCFTPDDPAHPQIGLEGTSLAAPLVAGHIANLLASPKVPIDMTTGKVARNMRDYLENSNDAAWSRPGGPRVLWNGVTEADNPKQPKLRCTGVAGNRYVGREALRAAIEDKGQFCDMATAPSAANPVTQRYYKDKMDDVQITVQYADPTKTRNRDDCIHLLLGILTDGCDGNDPVGNPANYKAGGTVILDDTYTIEPVQPLRKLAQLGIEGHCEGTEEGVFDRFWVWGHGWESSDGGDAMMQKLKKHASMTGWWFQYGLGKDDNREWTAKFNTVIGKRGTVEAILKEVGAPSDIKCSGSANH